MVVVRNAMLRNAPAAAVGRVGIVRNVDSIWHAVVIFPAQQTKIGRNI